MKRTKRTNAVARGAIFGPDPVLTDSGFTVEGLRTEEAVNSAETFKAARRYGERNAVINTALQLQLSFYNYGLRWKPEARSGAVTAWVKTNRKRLRDLARDVWREWLCLDNVVTFWREDSAVVFNLRPEDCKYTDKMGIQRLICHLANKPEELKGTDADGMRLSAEEQKRYMRSEITLDPNLGEHFRVMKRGPVGYGFAPVRMVASFHTLHQMESMEVGEKLYGYLSRDVIRQHQLGHEIKGGQRAGLGTWHWKQAWSDAVEKFFKGRHGFIEFSSNFDHLVKLVWVDPKNFDARKWDSPTNRLLWWGGPLTFMLVTKSLSPFLLRLAHGIAQDERDIVGEHLAEVVNEALQPPAPLQPVWSNRCFTDIRLALDMVKFLTTQGSLSLASGLEETGFDPDEEGERKTAEAKDPQKADKYLPLWDPSHGVPPSSPRKGGRPPGVPDPAQV